MPSPLRRVELYERVGRVVEVKGQAIESDGPDAFLGEVCEIRSPHARAPLLAEVVGFRDGRVCLTPFADPHGLSVGASVVATGEAFAVPVGPALLGRVIDPFGRPLDGGPPIDATQRMPLRASAVPAMTRRRIAQPVHTGVKAIDAFLPLGLGQRVGLFAGSGVGKSTLLGMVVRGVDVEVNVVALVGERGREVREFVEDHLGDEGLKRSVVVVATADTPAIVRLSAAYSATAIAEFFRDAGRSVLLTVDSLTRVAMARREIGLAAGEPPTSRGYTPSVFSELPALCERCGTSAGSGSITGVFTVLVEGDDFNEPVSDTARATLDGHIMLTRELASAGHYPPVDLLQSVSRLASVLWSAEQRTLVAQLLECLSTYERNRQLIEIGAWREGANAELDRAVQVVPALRRLLAQRGEETLPAAAARPQFWQQLAQLLRPQPAAQHVAQQAGGSHAART